MPAPGARTAADWIMIQLWVVRACLLPAVAFLSATAPAPGARTTTDWIMIRWWVVRASSWVTAPTPGARTTADWIMIRLWVVRSLLTARCRLLERHCACPRRPHHC